MCAGAHVLYARPKRFQGRPRRRFSQRMFACDAERASQSAIKSGRRTSERANERTHTHTLTRTMPPAGKLPQLSNDDDNDIGAAD